MATVTGRNDSQDVTASQLAAQFGFGTNHGAATWRVVLSSPLDAERCRVLLDKVARPEYFEFLPRHADAETTIPHAILASDPAAVSPIIAEFFDAHGLALATACISQLGEPGKMPWAPNARPLFALMREASSTSAFTSVVRDDPIGRKLYSAYLRSILRLIRDGAWVANVDRALQEWPSEDDKYTNINNNSRDTTDVDVLNALLVTLPVLLRTTAALGDTVPAQNARAVEHTRIQLDANIAALTALAGSTSANIWEGEHITETGARLAYVYAAFQQVSEALRS